jgi:hypothetical protein
MGIVLGQYYPKETKSEMDLLMERMFISNQKEEPKSELLNAETRVTREIIDEILNASSPPWHETGQHPMEIRHSIEIQTILRNTLGIDLAGYFDVEVSLRDRDAIVRLFYKGNALGVGANRDTKRAMKDALEVGILPSLKQLQKDLEKIIEKIPFRIDALGASL